MKLFAVVLALSSPVKVTPEAAAREILDAAQARGACATHAACEVYAISLHCCGQIAAAFPKGTLKADEAQRLRQLGAAIQKTEAALEVCDCAMSDNDVYCRNQRCLIWDTSRITDEYYSLVSDKFFEPQPKERARFDAMMKRAEAALKAGSYRAAVDDLRAFPVQGIADGRRLFLLGRARLRTKEFREAMQDFARAPASWPSIADEATYNQLCALSLMGAAPKAYQGALVALRNQLQGKPELMKKYLDLLAKDPDLKNFRAWKGYAKYVPAWLQSEQPMDYDL